MRRGFRRTSQDALSTSFLDLLSNGVGASIMLLLLFTISRGLAKPLETGGADALRVRFVLRDVVGEKEGGARPIVAVTINRGDGDQVSLPLEVLDREMLAASPHWERYDRGFLASSPVGIGAYPVHRGQFKRDYDIVVENPGTACWTFVVRFVDREHRRGYEFEEPGIDVAWVDRRGEPQDRQSLFRNDRYKAIRRSLGGKPGARTLEECTTPDQAKDQQTGV